MTACRIVSDEAGDLANMRGDLDILQDLRTSLEACLSDGEDFWNSFGS